MQRPEYDVLTARLRLHALSIEEARLAQRRDQAGLSERIGARVPASWPEAGLSASLGEIIAAMEQLAADERWVWVIIESHAGAVVGDIGFHSPVTGQASIELGYAIAQAFQGHGYATEAAQAMVRWAFGRPGVERVMLRIAPGNTRSLRVAEKLGMRETPSSEPDYRSFERLKASEQPSD